MLCRFVAFVGTHTYKQRSYYYSDDDITSRTSSTVICHVPFFLSLYRKKLLRSKCIAILYGLGLECFALTKSDLKSSDFAVNRFLRNYFDLIILKSL